MIARLLLVAVLLAPVPLLAADPPPRMSTTTVYGNDPCPTAANGDIIVCGRLPEEERFRIPKKLRKHKAERTEQSWVTRADSIDEVSRVGRPDSCSAVGSGGQTGCTAAMLRQWAAERRAAGYPVGIPF